MTEQQKEKLLQEVKRLHDRYVLSGRLTPDTFEPGMMEYLDQTDGTVDFETGQVSLRFEARGTRYEGRPEIIERIHENEPVQIVRDEENRFNPNNFVLLTNTGKNIGNMPAELCNALAPLYDKEELTIESAKVSFVDPLSKRNRHAKRPMIFILMEGKVIPKPETEVQERSLDNSRELVILPTPVFEEKINEGVPEKPEIIQAEPVPEKNDDSLIEENKQLFRENNSPEEDNVEKGEKQMEENNVAFASAQIKAILDRAQVKYSTVEDRYIFVEKDDIPAEILRTIRHSGYVHSVTAVMRVRKVCWKIRIKATENQNVPPAETNRSAPEKQEEKARPSSPASVEFTEKSSEPESLPVTGEEYNTIEENPDTIQVNEVAAEEKTPQAQPGESVEAEAPMLQSSESIQREDTIVPESPDETTADESLASVFGVALKAFETIKIEDLHLGVRAANCLSAVNCKTLSDILIKSKDELQSIPFMSPKSLDGIITKLRDYLSITR